MFNSILDSLPIISQEIKIRNHTRADYDILSKWTKYPWPFDVFNLRFASMDKNELDQLYNHRSEDKNRITLIVDINTNPAIGYVALLKINWARKTAENMAVRLHPDYCDRGIGSRVLRLLKEWWFGSGMRRLRLDVAASNYRAVRSYLNAGFHIVQEFWRDAPDLIDKDLSNQRYDFIREHLLLENAVPQIRFYWMET